MRPGPHSAELSWITARPIAHRGLHNKAEGILENTAPAFAAAMAGNYAIECDLQLSADGEAMVFHDETLDRVTEAKGPVIRRSAAELQRLNYRIGNARMQTLAELLAQVNGQVPLIIELKSHWNGDRSLAARAVKSLQGYRGRFALMSFDPDLVEAVREIDPTIIRGITADRMVDDEWKMLPLPKRMEMRHFTHLDRTAPHFVSYDVHGLPSDPVRHFRQNGLPVICWTVRSVETERRSHMHADQITFEGYLA
jgi:glycerophosphoryl diester phosphodiesterase